MKLRQKIFVNLFSVPVRLIVTGEPVLSIATNEQVASKPIPLTFSGEISATTD